jgi:hypothetical protein
MVRYLPGRGALAFALAVTFAAAWLIFAGLVGVAASLMRAEPLDVPALAILCGGLGSAQVGFERLADIRRIRARVRPAQLYRRRHGDLASTAAEEHRALRPIGVDRAEVVQRTDELLERLLDIPSVRLYRGVRLGGEREAVAAHAVSAGRMLLFVESVAWPPGRYAMDATGRVRCDGLAIGQSAGPLVRAALAFGRLLPRNHRVRSVVVVYRSGAGRYSLPADSRDLCWVYAEDVAERLAALLVRHRRTVSRHAVAALSPSGSA